MSFYCSSHLTIPSCTHPVLHTPFGVVFAFACGWSGDLGTFVLSRFILLVLFDDVRIATTLDIMHSMMFWKSEKGALGILAHVCAHPSEGEEERRRKRNSDLGKSNPSYSKINYTYLISLSQQITTFAFSVYCLLGLPDLVSSTEPWLGLA